MYRPDGKPGKYYYLDDSNAVVIIAEAEDADIYLVGQTRYPAGNVYSWELPGGSYKKNENPLVAAKRELKEETGLIATSWSSRLLLRKFIVGQF